MFDNFRDVFFPVGGGMIGSVLSYITVHNIIDTMIIAAVGAIIGYAVKWMADWFRYDILKKRKYEQRD